jgi:putative ABC transport system permease protein
MVDLSLKMMLHDKVRLLTTVAGVAFAVTLVVVQTGLFVGILSNASVTIDKTDADMWVTSKSVPNVDFAHPFPESYVQRVRSVPGVAHADGLIVAFMDIALPTGVQEQLLVYALEDFGRWKSPWNVKEGRIEDLRAGRYVFLDASSEKRLGKFAVGDYREIRGQRVKILGRTEEAVSFTTTPIAYMDYGLAQQLMPEFLGGRCCYVLIKLAPGADKDAVRAEIARRIPHADVHSRDDWSERSRSYWVASTGLGFNMFLTVFLGCLVGGVVVAQTLYTSTMEHLKEFGTVKAIGGTNADIYRILGRQALIAAIFGFGLGLIPPYAIRAALIASASTLKVTIPLSFLGLVFGGTIVVCLLAAMLSFRKVAAIDPALVFRG